MTIKVQISCCGFRRLLVVESLTAGSRERLANRFPTNGWTAVGTWLTSTKRLAFSGSSGILDQSPI
jgi:hypothetical protein